MTESSQSWPPKRQARERTSHRIPDWSKPPLAMHEQEGFDCKYDFGGNPHVCQVTYNKWMRCRRANPVSYDATLVCQKENEDYIECYYAFKKRARDSRGKELWAEFELRKSNGTLPKLQKKYTPLFCQ